ISSATVRSSAGRSAGGSTSMTQLTVWIAFACVAVVGCASARPEQIGYSDFRDYGDTPLSHTVYLGSDQAYHYFAWTHDKSGGKWKVPKVEMAIANEFSTGSREAFLAKNPEGT